MQRSAMNEERLKDGQGGYSFYVLVAPRLLAEQYVYYFLFLTEAKAIFEMTLLANSRTKVMLYSTRCDLGEFPNT